MHHVINSEGKVLSPKVKTKRTWADTKITWQAASAVTLNSTFKPLNATLSPGLTREELDLAIVRS